MSRQTTTNVFDTDDGALLIVRNECSGMVGESVVWQELYFIKYSAGLPVATKVDFAFAEPILREHLFNLEGADKEFGPMPGLEGVYKTAYDYALYLSAMERESIRDLIYQLSPEGQQEQHNSMNADAISRVI